MTERLGSVAITDEMVGETPLAVAPVRHDLPGRRAIPEPNVHLSDVEKRVCELADSGFAPGTIALRCRIGEGTVDRILRSSDADRYREWLSAQRDVDMEYLDITWAELECLATSRLSKILKEGKSESAALTAVREVLDRHPGRRYVKVTREEKWTHTTRGSDNPARDNSRAINILAEVRDAGSDVSLPVQSKEVSCA